MRSAHQEGMQQHHVLEWEMQGRGSAVHFTAARDGQGYALTVHKDGALAMAGTAPDGTALLRQSQHLRATLQQMGYAPAVAADVVPQLAGGPCWGPAPLPLSLLRIPTR